MHLCHLSWDPPRECVVIPFFHLPIMWYGVLFALGFALGYLVFEKLLRLFFVYHPILSDRDILSFERLLMTLKNHEDDAAFAKIWAKMSTPLKEQIKQWNLNHSVDDEIRLGTLAALNNFITDQEVKISDLNISKLTKLKSHLLPKKLSHEELTSLLRRLYLEKLLNCSMLPFLVRVKECTEKLAFSLALGAIIGARLVHVLFYEDACFYLTHPLEILKVREGGLASHGGVLGVMVATLYFLIKYRKAYPFLSFISILDLLGIPALIAACCIRLGNFINQEVLGKVSQLPWAIIFGHPADGSLPVARHPAQLYEAFIYLGLFCLLFTSNNRSKISKTGFISGIVLLTVFTFRFFIEFIKEEQTIYALKFLNMGQFLSLPLAICGAYLLLRRKWKQSKKKEKLPILN